MITITCSTSTIQLRNPEIGDSLSVNFNVAQSSSGDIVKVFKDVNWKTIKAYTYEILNLADSEIVDFLYFVDRYSGKQMTLVDYEGNAIVGVIQLQSINTVKMTDTTNRLIFTFEEE